MSRFICFALSICLLGFASPCHQAAAQGALDELYGEGVHRYFAGDYIGASQLLAQVADSGSPDPRAHYFLGLTREMQGGGGQADFENGARLEAEGKRVVNVGAALTRIQGAMRTKIEQARRSARVQARQQKIMLQQAKRDSGMMAPAESPAPAVPSDTGETDPFSGDGLRSESTVVEESAAAPEVDSSSDPFIDEPAAADAPTTGADAGNPFDTGAGSDPTNPFGGTDSGATEGDATNPFGSEPTGGDAGGTGENPFSNPFGTDQ